MNLGFYLATLIRSSGLLFLVVLLFIFAVSMSGRSFFFSFSVLIDCNYINNSDNSVTLLSLDPLRPLF